MKSDWQRIDIGIAMCHFELAAEEEGLKGNGSYGKAKTGIPSVHWAFALNNREVWIELEIKAKNGQPQESVYNQIHAKSVEIEKSLGYKIRWNKEDLIISSRRETGGDYRIKTVMPFSLDDIRSRKSNTIESWAERIVLFIQVFSQYLSGKNDSAVIEKAEVNLGKAYLPEKSDIDCAEEQIRKTPDEVVSIENVLNQVEKNFSKARKLLRDNWRTTTKHNIQIWFRNK